MKNLKLSEKQGFTFVEIMLVVIIIAVLASMLAPRLAGRSEQAKESVAKADVEATIATALKLYELDNGRFPSTNQGLDALLSKPSSGPVGDWRGPYLEKEPIDPWGRRYMYTSPGKYRKDYDLYSKGPDAALTDDDIRNWQQ